MLSILSLFGLAFAATMLPDSNSEDTADSAEETASGTLGNDGDGDSLLSFGSADSAIAETSDTAVLTASGTLGHDADGDSGLSFDSAEMNITNQILSIQDDGYETDFGDDLIEDDTFIGTDNDEVLIGTDGDDTLHGGGGTDMMDGGEGDDTIFANDDDTADMVHGGDGNDQMLLGDGDTAEGGRGDDWFKISDEGTTHITDYNPDDDRIEVAYDPAGPVPVLDAQQTDTGYNLTADGRIVAVLNDAKDFDVSTVSLVVQAA